MPGDTTITLPSTSGGPTLDAETYTNDSSTSVDRERIACIPGSPTAMQTTPANVAFTNSGNTQVVAGQASQSIRIMRMLLSVNAPTNIEILDGASTVLLGPYYLGAGGSIVLDDSGEPWSVGTDGNALNVNSSVAVNGTITVWYTQS